VAGEPASEFVAQPDLVAPEIGAGTAESVITVLHARLCATTPAVKDAPGFLAARLQRARVKRDGAPAAESEDELRAIISRTIYVAV
jgi:hypothetical protein